MVNGSGSAAKRWRRYAFVKRARLAAIAAHATLDLVVDPTAEIGPDVRVTVAPWSNNLLHIGAGTTLADRVLIQLSNGRARIGDMLQMRRDCILNVSGDLDIAGDSVISWGTVIHCSNRVFLDRGVLVGEYTTIVDSSHYFTEPDAHLWHHVRSGTVEIGRSSWICAKAVITRDTKIGDYCIVGANSVVRGEVPSGSFASGIPATIRPLSLPW
jgi:acetyltransferase-like isoleucine patch superfamily enzyme